MTTDSAEAAIPAGQPAASRPAPLAGARLPRIHWLLAVQTVVIVLGSLNRLGPWTTGFVAGNEFLRWVDLHNMVTLPLISVSAFYLLLVELGRGRTSKGRGQPLLLNLVFILSVYLLGASYGNHEITNYLHARFCPDLGGDLCRIVIFNDDDFSHWLFFTGFVLINSALMLLQVLNPHATPPGRRDLLLLMGNGLFVALGIMANLGFEDIGLDLFVIVILAVAAVWLLRRFGRQPLLVYYATAYGGGLAATVMVRFLTG